MQNLQDIEDKIFFECKTILDSLSKINSKDELIQKQDLFYEISERISFLKILEKNESSFLETPTPINDFEENTSHLVSENVDVFVENEDLTIEEEVAFTNELNQIHDSIQEDELLEKNNNVVEEDLLVEIPKIEESVVETSPEAVVVSLNVDSSEEQEKLEFPEIVEQEIIVFEDEKPVENLTMSFEDENLEKKINEDLTVAVEEEMPENAPVADNNWFDAKNEEEENMHEKKFKLANIKGLKSLFDDEHLDSLENPTINSQARANVSTSYMEAEKIKHEFKLDLNDRLAFSKMLFGGSQSELNETVNQLNQFQDVEQAKEYLSELYYEKKWDRAEEYAQRLWTLVENKFL